MRTLLQTAEKVLGPSAQVPALGLVDDAGREHQQLALVLVSNNPYTLDRPLTPGARPALDSGRLGIIVLDAPGAAAHPPGATPHPLGHAWSAPRLQVSALPPVHAGIDGEASELSPPLQFTIRPAALRVRISPRQHGTPPSAPSSPARQTRPPPQTYPPGRTPPRQGGRSPPAQVGSRPRSTRSHAAATVAAVPAPTIEP